MMTLRTPLAFLAALAGGSVAHARDVPVSNGQQLVAAITGAQAGDVITLASGNYALTGVTCGAAGTPTEPIIVRSAVPLGAKLQMDAQEGFKVTGPRWHFEGLDISGVCASDDVCEHAFHVTGNAVGFVLRDSRVFDFNAQLKVNSEQVAGVWRTPHSGLVEGNELADSHARDTSKPTTKLNIDTGDDWIVRANYIHDAHKGAGDLVSYAAFMKSGGRNGLFERNLVICSRTDTSGGTRIGLSFGGGGTGAQFCAPAFDAAVPCDTEHRGGTMRNNIIINCSDVGIYLNKASDTKLLFNTLIATNGIDFRYASSTGEVDGNVLAGKIRAREGGAFVNKTNLSDVASFSDWYVSPLTGDLTAKGDMAALLGKVDARADVSDDYCARPRGAARLSLGALEHSLGDCSTTRPPLGAPGKADAGVGQPDADAGSNNAGPGQLAEAGVMGTDGGNVGVDAGVTGADGGGVDAADDDEPSSGGGGCSVSVRSAASAWQMALFAFGLTLLRRRLRRSHAPECSRSVF